MAVGRHGPLPPGVLTQARSEKLWNFPLLRKSRLRHHKLRSGIRENSDPLDDFPEPPRNSHEFRYTHERLGL
jgi:hypothetical protein